MAKAPPEKTPPSTAKKSPPPARSAPAAKSAGKPALSFVTKPASGARAGNAKAAKPAPPAPAAARPVAKAAKPAPAFPKKNQPPAGGAFAARLPLPLGKRFDLARSFLLKQTGVREDVYFYGPETGWALRYLVAGRPLCSLHIYDEQPVGIVSLGAAATAGVDWRALSPLGQKARKQAHGSPTLLWLDVPLEGTGANDFRTILRAKLAAHESDGEDLEVAEAAPAVGPNGSAGDTLAGWDDDT
jgi:hypothetical protein